MIEIIDTALDAICVVGMMACVVMAVIWIQDTWRR